MGQMENNSSKEEKREAPLRKKVKKNCLWTENIHTEPRNIDELIFLRKKYVTAKVMGHFSPLALLSCSLVYASI